MAGSAARSASAAAMARYERRLRAMTRAVLLADDRRVALGVVAAGACQAAGGDLGAIFIRDADGDDAIVAPASRWSARVTAFGPTSALPGLLFENPPSKPDLMDLTDYGLGPAMGSSVVSPKRARGLLLVARRPGARPYSGFDLEVIAPYAAAAGLAVAFAEARSGVERGLLLKDRNRIARELHDGVIQSLYGIGMVLEGIRAETFQQPAVEEQLSGITDSINGVIDDLRAYINDLTPARLAKRGLGPELCALANEFQASSGVITSVRLHDGVEEIKAALGRDIVQITREALSNVAKHAAASHAVVSVRCTAHGVRLEITDDGRGIAPRRIAGRGLANMVRRAEAWGGSAEIHATSGRGTVVSVSVPAPASGATSPGVTGPLAIAG